MTKKSKVLSGLILSAVVATGLYASHHSDDFKKNFKNGYCSGKAMMKRAHHGKMGMPVLKILKQLNLTDAQKDKIKTIVKEQMKNKQTINDAFTKSSFDKEKFIKIMSEKRENMLKSKANIIEKVYAVLDSKQKEQFKTLIDLKAEKKANRFN